MPSEGGGAASILNPFPAWKLPREEVVKEDLISPHVGRTLRRSPSASSSAHSAAVSPPPQPRPKRFNLRDGVQEAMKSIKERVEAKEMVVADALYSFYSSEICLHFLHALSAYFIGLAKECTAMVDQAQPSDLDSLAGAGEGGPSLRGELGVPRAGLENRVIRDDETKEAEIAQRAALLREVGRGYGRILVYCSNFERTSADALFFESLLYLARLVVAAAVSEPLLAPQMDKEFDRILRGGVFHPTPLKPPRPRPSRPPPMSAGSKQQRLVTSPGRRPDGFPRQNGDSGSGAHKRWAILSGGGSRPNTATASLPSAGEAKKGYMNTGIIGRNTTNPTQQQQRGSSARRGRTGTTTNRCSLESSPPGARDKRGAGRPSAGREAGSAAHSRNLDDYHGAKGLSATPYRPVSSTRKAGGTRAIPSGKKAEDPSEGGGEVGQDGCTESRSAEASPAFDELSRWKVSRGSVTRMVRLAVEVQQVALSNLALAENYRKALAIKFQRAGAVTATAASSSPPTPSPRSNVGQRGTSKGYQSRQEKQAGNRKTGMAGERPSIGTAADASRPSWRRRGRALTPGRRKCGGVQAYDVGAREFFNAEALSVCIASIVEE